MATGWRNPKHDLSEQSKVVMEQGFALSLALLTMIFLTYKTFEVKAYESDGTTEYVEIEEIPETEQMKKPPPPQRPQIPVPTESEDIPEDVTIMDTELDLDAPPPPPPPPPGANRQKEESPIFLAWEEPPEPTKRVQPEYPSMAVKAGVEGKVILNIVVDERGDVLEATVVTANPPGIFEDAAIAAMLQWKFKPAKQRDLPIKVRLAYPINFTLTGGIPPS